MFVVKRILMIVPTLLVLSILGFMINHLSPGDPVESILGGYAAQAGGGSETTRAEQRATWRHKLGMDLPLFYLEISPLSAPDTLYKIDKFEKEPLERLLDQSGNWEATVNYYRQIDVVKSHLLDKRLKMVENSVASDNSLQAIQIIKSSADPQVIQFQLAELLKSLSGKTNMSIALEAALELKDLYKQYRLNTSKWKNYVPSVRFHGYNQYHRWLFGDGGENTKGIIRGDFGTSYTTGRPVSEIIWEKLFWSVLLTMISMVLAYAISIPIGVYSAVSRGKWFDKVSGTLLYVLYAMPSFWVAVLLLMGFANPKALDWFPASGVMPIGGHTASSIWGKMWQTLPYLILPIVCYTYGSIAFLSKSVRASYLDVLNEDFMKTAKSKGLSPKTVLFKHGLRNALLPLITVFPNIFPAAIGGAVILESIFSIPGMGTEILLAVRSQDYPIIQSVILLSGLVTMIGYALSDVLYMVVDPRINLKK